MAAPMAAWEMQEYILRMAQTIEAQEARIRWLESGYYTLNEQWQWYFAQSFKMAHRQSEDFKSEETGNKNKNKIPRAKIEDDVNTTSAMMMNKNIHYVNPRLYEHLLETIAKIAQKAVTAAGMDEKVVILESDSVDAWTLAPAVSRLYICIPFIICSN